VQVEKVMSTHEIAEGQKLTHEWLKEHERVVR